MAPMAREIGVVVIGCGIGSTTAHITTIMEAISDHQHVVIIGDIHVEKFAIHANPFCSDRIDAVFFDVSSEEPEYTNIIELKIREGHPVLNRWPVLFARRETESKCLRWEATSDINHQQHYNDRVKAISESSQRVPE